MITFDNCECKVEKGKFNINDINLDCLAVWRLIASGHTVGVFQLEKNLGQDWAKRVKPQNIEELAALVSLLRPGPLGAGLSQDYVDIKFGRKKHSYLHPSLKPILESTQAQMVFQEQALRIATDIAGFGPVEADTLRKSIGKKKPELMAKLKTRFIEGCQTHSKIGKGIAEEIFGWIEKCQRYSFNKCIAGDTIIYRPADNRYNRQLTISEMYEIMNFNISGDKKLYADMRSDWIKQGHYGFGLSLCSDGKIRKNIIRNIYKAGVHKLYLVTLSNGKAIRVTSNHKFPVPNGYKMLSELKPGDSLYTIDVTNKINIEDNRCRLVTIDTIWPDETELVWDVAMDAPDHNFAVNNGIVTCNSHAISYGMISYQTSWLKCHFPQEFFASCLTYSQYKGDPKEEIYKLVQDSRLFGVDILPPDIRRGNIHFKMTKEPQKGVAFGLSHIRGVGASAIQKIVSASSDNSGTGSLETWGDFLAAVPSFHKNVGIALIKSGACDCYGMGRSEMVRELEVVLGTTVRDSTGKRIEIKGLTNKERIYFFDYLQKDVMTTQEILRQMARPTGDKTKTMRQMTKKELVVLAVGYLYQADAAFDGMMDGDDKLVYTSIAEKESWLENIGNYTKKKIEELMLQNGYKDIIVKPPCSSDARRKIVATKAEMLEESLDDTNTAKATAEKHFLGIALSCSQTDDADDTLATHTCLDIAKAPNQEDIVVCAIIDGVKHTKTKRGKNPGQPMCFLTISDSTYSIDYAVVFPDVFGRLKAFCKDDLICLIYGTKKNSSFIISDIQKLM